MLPAARPRACPNVLVFCLIVAILQPQLELLQGIVQGENCRREALECRERSAWSAPKEMLGDRETRGGSKSNGVRCLKANLPATSARYRARCAGGSAANARVQPPVRVSAISSHKEVPRPASVLPLREPSRVRPRAFALSWPGRPARRAFG